MNVLEARFTMDYSGFRLDVACSMPLTGVVAIFGSSGSGKTTLLRCIAGFIRPNSGYLKVGEVVWQDDQNFIPVQHRRVGVVFQDIRLFPHMNVKQNLEYGLKRLPAGARGLQLSQIVEVLGLGSLLDRRVHHLSGGEQQRVAIGRVLVTSPHLLLMDEPLASLDRERKQDILPFLHRLHHEFQIPVLYVSHDLDEILQLANHIVLMKEGRVVASGSIHEVFSRMDLPEFVAPHLVGSILDTRIVRHEPEFGLTQVEFEGRALFVPQQRLPVGAPLRVHIHARDVSIVVGGPLPASSVLNALEARVVEIAESPSDPYAMEIKLDVGCPLVALITKKSFHRLGLKPGHMVHAHFKAVALG